MIIGNGYINKTPWYIKLRYWAILVLAGDMPVVLNMVVQRPPSFDGSLVKFTNHCYGLFCRNYLNGEMHDDVILMPKRCRNQ